MTHKDRAPCITRGICLEREHDLLAPQGVWVYTLLNRVWSKAWLPFSLNRSRQDAFNAGCVILNNSKALTRCDTDGAF